MVYVESLSDDSPLVLYPTETIRSKFKCFETA